MSEETAFKQIFVAVVGSEKSFVDLISPSKGIAEDGEKNRIDLIVVETRGLGGFTRLLLGSVASGVLSSAHCSVMVVS